MRYHKSAEDRGEKNIVEKYTNLEKFRKMDMFLKKKKKNKTSIHPRSQIPVKYLLKITHIQFQKENDKLALEEKEQE